MTGMEQSRNLHGTCFSNQRNHTQQVPTSSAGAETFCDSSMQHVSAQLRGQACSESCAKVSRRMQLSRPEALRDGVLIVICPPTGLAPLQ